MARPVDRAVDALVELDQRAVVTAPPRPEQREQLVQLVQICLDRALRGQAGRLGLEHEPHLAEPGEIAHVDGRDEDPASREHLDEPFLREPAERLADGRPADPELRRQLRLAHRRAGWQLERHDQLANRVVRPIGEGQPLLDGGSEARLAGPGHGDILRARSAASVHV